MVTSFNPVTNEVIDKPTPVNVFSDINWTGITWLPDSQYQIDFPVTVHPYIENIKN